MATTAPIRSPLILLSAFKIGGRRPGTSYRRILPAPALQPATPRRICRSTRRFPPVGRRSPSTAVSTSKSITQSTNTQPRRASIAYLGDEEHPPEREERGPVRPGWIGFGEQRNELLAKPLVLLIIELFADRQ